MRGAWETVTAVKDDRGRITHYVLTLIDITARKAAEQNQGLPPRYTALFHRWFLFGIPGFGAVMAILWLMIAKPI